MVAESHARSEYPSRRRRWRSWLAPGPPGAVLTIVGLIPNSDGRLRIELFPEVQGLSETDMRQLAEIRKLGGEAHFMERSPRFLGRFGGHDLPTRA